MTNYLSLFEEQQEIIFDLGNLINDIYTAPFNVTLTSTFFTASDSITPADTILPISARKGSQDMPSVFTVPPDSASNNLRLPRNTKKAVVTIAATGQSEEEVSLHVQPPYQRRLTFAVLVEQRATVDDQHISRLRTLRILSLA
jgi:hypothetical protein